MPTTTCIPAPSVLIAEDGLSVTLKAADATSGISGGAGPTPASLLAHLSSLGIVAADRKAIEGMAGLDGRISPAKDVVLVQGRRPVPQRPGRVELLTAAEDDTASNESASHYDRTSHVTAKSG